MKFGVRVGMLKVPWNEVYGKAGELGFDGVEMEVGQNYEEAEVLDAEKRKAIKEIMKQTGVETSCVCIGGLWKYGPADDDASIRETAKKIVEATIEACEDLGTGFILAPLNDSGVQSEVARERWINFLRELAPKAEKHNVVIAAEICARRLLATADDLKSLVDAVGSSHVRGYFDVANARAADCDPAEGIRSLGTEYLALIHMKDLKPNPPGSERPYSVVGLGEGILDFDEICRAIHDIGYDRYLTLETPPGDDASASARKNLEYLKSKI